MNTNKTERHEMLIMVSLVIELWTNRFLQNVSDDSNSPYIHGFVVLLSLEHLWRDIARRAANSLHCLFVVDAREAEIGNLFENCVYRAACLATGSTTYVGEHRSCAKATRQKQRVSCCQWAVLCEARWPRSGYFAKVVQRNFKMWRNLNNVLDRWFQPFSAQGPSF